MKTVKDKYLVVGADFAGYPLKEAAERAAVAAGISVTKKGAAGSIPAAKDVEKYLCT